MLAPKGDPLNSRSLSHRLLPCVYVLFFLSGATGLIYEVVWARMLTQIFGNTTHAIATVLSAFMAGLALGSYSFGRIVDARKNALLAYGLLEGGVGIYALLVPTLLGLTQQAYSRLYGLVDVSFAAFSLVLFLLSFLVIVVPTALMGATLPVLSRFCVTRFASLGRRIGDLYAVNTLGAVLGCAFAGFLLISSLGLRGTVRLAASFNLAIAVVIVLMVAWAGTRGVVLGGREEEAAGRTDGTRSRLDVVLLAGFALSGAAAMIYENAWTRALTLVIGMSTYSFSVMLTTFLVGLALGSLLYARWWGGREMGIAGFGLLQLLIALSALATIPLFERLPFLFLRLRHGFGDSFQQFLTIQMLLSALVMILPTLLLGATFPVVARIYTQSIYRVGSSVGTAYASNTLGAIVGAFLGGFVFIPFLGVQNSIGLAVVMNAAVGVLLVSLDSRVGVGRRIVAAAGMLVFSAAALLGFRTWDKGIMTSGVTIYASNYKSLPSDALRREWMTRDELLYYREGLTATISVHRSYGADYIYEKTNGKVDASYGDTPTQLMVGYLPMLFNPEAKRVLVIGMGSGMTAKAVAAFPVTRLEVAEIEPAVIEGARFFAEKNGRIHDDPRVRFIHADGRNYLLAVQERYDAIISEPSNPWIAGVGNLFTREYYTLAREKLADGGVFGQWMQTYAMAPEDLRMVYRTFAEVFPDVSLWGVNDSDMLLIGTLRPQRLRYADLERAVADRPVAQRDLRGLGIRNPYSLLAMYLMPKSALLKMAGDAEINLDDVPRLEYSAPRNLGRDTVDLNSGLTKKFVVPPVVEDADPARDASGRLALYLAYGYKAVRDREQALTWVERGLAKNPMDAEARMLHARLLANDGRSAEAAEELRKVMTGPAPLLGEVAEVAKSLDSDDAIPILRQVRQRDPRLLLARVALADALLQAGHPRQAESEYRELQPAHPSDPRILFGLGKALLVESDYAPALAALDGAAKLGETSAELQSQRGETLMWLGRYREAAMAYRQALRGNVEEVTWRLNLGISLAQLGPAYTGETEQRFREVLAMDPDNTRAWEELHNLGKRF
ncbi:MAG TPA: fused MFS/spermidine synthase [Candidatus Methylomirabilis sp.]|nr:fused MFS/spermidine synthase [Candidatus Methylomirabilis sp.]